MNDDNNKIANNLYELRRHGNQEFPFAIYKNHFIKKRLQYISLHWHPEIEIIYIDNGSLELMINEKKYILKKNDAMLVNPYELHGMTMLEECIWYATVFNPRLIYGFDDSVIKSKYFKNSPFHNILLQDSAKYYLKEILVTDKNVVNYELKIIKNLLGLYDEIYQKIDDNLLTSSSAINNIKVKKLIDFINENYNNKIKIDDAAHKLGICRSEICKLFRYELHTTFTEYISRLRIEHAIELLNSSEANITQISELVGFNSSSYFTEIFKRFYNISPLEYKNQYITKKTSKC